MVAAKPRLRSQVKFTVVRDEGLIIVQDEGEVHIVNDVAAFLLPLLDGTRTLDDLVDVLTAAYEVTAEQARTDLLELLETLARHKVIDAE